MRPWQERPPEAASLLNPAFCAVVLTSAVGGYVEEVQTGMPFVLPFLALPIVLHKQTRSALPGTIRTSMPAWLESNAEARIGFAERVRAIAPYAREALLFGSTRGAIGFSSTGTVVLGASQLGIKKFARSTTDETRACVEKARFVGRWFAGGGTAQTVLALWGVRP